MDLGHRLTNNELAIAERKIMQMYRRSEKELSGIIRNYFAEFEQLDEERREWVKEGKMTQSDYLTWRRVRMANGERFAALRNDLAQRMTNSHAVALEYINKIMPKVYALNHNYAAYKIEMAGENVAFNLYDETTIRELMVNNPDIMPEYNPYFPKSLGLRTPKDLLYGKQTITREVTSGILQGKSVYEVADSLQHRISTMNRVSAVRAARTGVTAAQNGGRMATYAEAEKMGIKLKKQWVATLDARTRDSHAAIDGETVANDKKFSNGLRYPGDPQGRPEEVYNCRCTMIADIEDSPYAKTYTAPDGQQAEYRSFKEWISGKLAQGNVELVHYAEARYNTYEVVDTIPAMAQYPEYSRISGRKYGADSAIENAQKTNPNYMTLEYVYTHNCQRCVPVWEYRERGFDVVAQPCKPFSEADGLMTSAFSVWNFNMFDSDSTKRVQIDKENTGKEKIIDFLKKCGNNARVEINVDWIGKDYGHVFAAKNVDGDIIFVDPQTGKTGKSVEAYFDSAKKGHTRWLRIDNLSIRESIRNEVIANPYG